MTRSTLPLFFSLIVLLLVFDSSATDVRRFTAAPKRAHLRRRGLNFEPSSREHTLLFEDETSADSAARVHLVPKYPTIVLDDVSDHIRDVACTTSSIAIHFHAHEAMETAAKSWSTPSHFILISTHTTCASEGAHEPYLVKYMSSDPDSRSITLQATKQTFKEATHRVSVDLGKHVVNDIEPRIVRRLPATTSSSVSQNIQTASLPATVSFQFQQPTGKPDGLKTTKNINFAVKNKAVLPPNPDIVALFPGAAPLSSVALSCKDCSMSGSVSLEAAGFNVSSNALGTFIDFFDNGFFQFTANKLAAHMEIDIDLLPGFALASFTANLARFPLNPIEIPKVFMLGPAIELTIPMGIKLNTPVNFTTGFDISVPDNSKIILDVGEITNSTQIGFNQTKFQPIPFTAKVDNLNLNFTAALKPRLVLSAGIATVPSGLNVGGGVGAFMDFPRLNANVQSVQNVNNTCNGPAPQGTTNRAVHFIPSATFDMGLHWELDVGFSAIQQVRGGEQVLISRTAPLPNQCLVLDSKTNTLVDAAGAKSGAQNAGVRLQQNMMSGCAVLLLITALTFFSL